MKSLIVLNNISFEYNNYKILKSINLEIKEGEKIALIGKSGAVKFHLVDQKFQSFDKYEKNLYQE